MPSRVVAALMLQTAIAAGTYLAAKRTLDEVAALNLFVTRSILSGAFMAALLWALGGRSALPPRALGGRLLLLGLLCGPVNQSLFLWGLARSTPAHAALMYALTPAGVYVLALAARRESWSASRGIGIAVAFAGVAVLLLGRGLRVASSSVVGDAAILVAMVAWALYTTAMKDLSRVHGSLRPVGWTLGAAAVASLPLAPLVFDAAQWREASPVAWSGLVFMVLLASGAAYALWGYALRRVEASRVAVFSNLGPPATAVAAWLLLGEPLVWELWVGGALVLLGVWVTQRPR